MGMVESIGTMLKAAMGTATERKTEMKKLFKIMYRANRLWFNNVVFDDRQIMLNNIIIHCHVCGINLDSLLDSDDYIKLCDYFNINEL